RNPVSNWGPFLTHSVDFRGAVPICPHENDWGAPGKCSAERAPNPSCNNVDRSSTDSIWQTRRNRRCIAAEIGSMVGLPRTIVTHSCRSDSSLKIISSDFYADYV